VGPEGGDGLSKNFGERHGEALKFQGFKVTKFQGIRISGTDLETLKP